VAVVLGVAAGVCGAAVDGAALLPALLVPPLAAAAAAAGAADRVGIGSRRSTAGAASPAWRTTTLLDAQACRRTVAAERTGVAGAGAAAMRLGPTAFTGVAGRRLDATAVGVGSVPDGRCRSAVGSDPAAVVRRTGGAGGDGADAAADPAGEDATAGAAAPAGAAVVGVPVVGPAVAVAGLEAAGLEGAGLAGAGVRRTTLAKRERSARSCHGARTLRRTGAAAWPAGVLVDGLVDVLVVVLDEVPVGVLRAVDGAAADGAAADGAGGGGGTAGSPGADEPDVGRAGCRGARVVDRRTAGGRAVAAATWGAAGGALRPVRLALSLARSVEVSIGPTATTSSSRRTGTASPRRAPTMPPGVYDASSGTERAARGRARSGSRWIVTGRAGASQAGGAGVPVDAGVDAGLDAGLDACPCAGAGASGRGVHQRGGALLPPRPRGSGPIRARRMSTGREVAAANRDTDEARLPICVGSGRSTGGPGSRIRRTTSRPSRSSGRSSAWGVPGTVVMTPA